MPLNQPFESFRSWLETGLHLLVLRFLGPGPAEVFALWLTAKRNERKKVDHVHP